MEERHSFSDPRPVPGLLLPTWEVDVFREGVDDPVLTLRIDDTTLPPRVRKRKVVWKLPDALDVMPNFGSDEKKRLLDLFKQEKKHRRKSSKRNSLTQLNPTEDSPPPNSNRGKRLNLEEDSTTSESGKNGKFKVKKAKEPPAIPGKRKLGKNGSKVQLDRAVSYGSSASDDSPAPDNTAISPPGSGSGKKNEMETSHLPETETPKPELPQPAVDPLPPDATETRGEAETPFQPDSTPPQAITPESMSMSTQGSHPVSPLSRLSPTTSPPPGFAMAILTLSDPPPRPPADYFAIPSSATNIPVELAKSFIDVYYSSVTHGQQEELLLHYSPEAQKSLSVGEAHAFCQSRQDILGQLKSLHGSMWDVRGVVAQPGFMGSVVLLLNGMTLPVNAHALVFSHTVTLVKSEEGYQIYNDAMALLTGGANGTT